ncbi:DUF2147 domain-containing protein [Siculibacillus lacustris]|uniref:DUF2147 domain-containing protein n=1 Tax=Siculibacillus lacustris TaxID=1549641 RepID=A0A4V2KTX2_9HYPH|nr:DUF2147 domain-containing protein [Siculibacillus lacustris]TBW39060.1 DUF2147 domain-containing protein [Siculibacillus lacustris]
MKRTTIFAAALVALLDVAGAAAADPHGVWLRESGSAKIKIDDCSGGLCGVVVWERNPRKDIYNPDAAKRGEPVIGRTVILGMKPTDKPDQWKGEVYNAEDGKTYTGYVTMRADGKLDLQGCVFGGLICKSDTWSRSSR